MATDPRPGELELELLELQEELWEEDDAPDHTGWSCVRTDPFPCPAEGCDEVAAFGGTGEGVGRPVHAVRPE